MISNKLGIIIFTLGAKIIHYNLLLQALDQELQIRNVYSYNIFFILLFFVLFFFYNFYFNFFQFTIF